MLGAREKEKKKKTSKMSYSPCKHMLISGEDFCSDEGRRPCQWTDLKDGGFRSVMLIMLFGRSPIVEPWIVDFDSSHSSVACDNGTAPVTVEDGSIGGNGEESWLCFRLCSLKAFGKKLPTTTWWSREKWTSQFSIMVIHLLHSLIAS